MLDLENVEIGIDGNIVFNSETGEEIINLDDCSKEDFIKIIMVLLEDIATLEEKNEDLTDKVNEAEDQLQMYIDNHDNDKNYYEEEY